MASQATELAVPQEHGAVASAVKWAFTTFFKARQVIDDVVAEARDEWEDGRAESPATPLTIAGDLPTRMPRAMTAEPLPTAKVAAPMSAAMTAEPLPTPVRVAGGSDEGFDKRPVWTRGEPMAVPVRRANDQMVVRWFSKTGIEERPTRDLSSLLKRDDGYVWVDVPTFDATAERILADAFAFHPLALRDCREPGHMPKVHAYDDHLFIVLHAPQRDENGQVHHRELNQFIGHRYVVTVHERLGTPPIDVRDLETTYVINRIVTGRVRPSTSAGLSYAIASRLSVGMEEMVAELASSVAALEAAVSTHERHVLRRPKDDPDSIVDEMFQLRHSLLAIETIADQNRVVYARAGALASRAMSRDERRLMEDVEDQFSRVRQICGGQKELLQGVLDFSRTRTSAKMDLAMSRLALLSAVAMPISIISSIFGMQIWVFPNSRLDILAGLLVLMGAMTYAMLRWARNQGWW